MTVTDSTPRIQLDQIARVTDAHQATLAIVYVRQSIWSSRAPPSIRLLPRMHAQASRWSDEQC